MNCIPTRAKFTQSEFTIIMEALEIDFNKCHRISMLTRRTGIETILARFYKLRNNSSNCHVPYSGPVIQVKQYAIKYELKPIS